MPIVAILEWPATAGLDMKSEYARVSDELNGGRMFSSPADWTPGLISHAAAGTDDGGGLVVDVWEDEAHLETWMQKVMPLMADRPEPSVRIHETINVVTAAQPAHV